MLGILQFIHSHNVIHRDIKPDNIIRRQKDGKLVLIDFGAVKQVQTQLLTVQGARGLLLSFVSRIYVYRTGAR